MSLWAPASHGCLQEHCRDCRGQGRSSPHRTQMTSTCFEPRCCETAPAGQRRCALAWLSRERFRHPVSCCGGVSLPCSHVIQSSVLSHDTVVSSGHPTLPPLAARKSNPCEKPTGRSEDQAYNELRLCGCWTMFRCFSSTADLGQQCFALPRCWPAVTSCCFSDGATSRGARHPRPQLTRDTPVR